MKDFSVAPVTPLTPDVYVSLVRAALAEDVGSGDITTEATVPPTAIAHGILLASRHWLSQGSTSRLRSFSPSVPASP